MSWQSSEYPDTYDWAAIEEKLRHALVKKRYDHTLGVTYTACALAMCHGADLTQARIAGLLHDCAKCIPDEEKLQLCDANKLDVTELERSHTGLLHAKLGALLAEQEYGVHDPDVRAAIRWHTTGRPEMSTLEKIIYIADYIEPHRYKAKHLPEIRRLAFEDLDRCLLRILRYTVDYLADSHPKAIDPMTRKAYEYYRDAGKE